jgi:hypothetical protein
MPGDEPRIARPAAVVRPGTLAQAATRLMTEHLKHGGAENGRLRVSYSCRSDRRRGRSSQQSL